MGNTPGQRWEKILLDSDGHEWFQEAEIVVSAGGYCYNQVGNNTIILNNLI